MTPKRYTTMPCAQSTPEKVPKCEPTVFEMTPSPTRCYQDMFIPELPMLLPACSVTASSMHERVVSPIAAAEPCSDVISDCAKVTALISRFKDVAIAITKDSDSFDPATVASLPETASMQDDLHKILSRLDAGLPCDRLMRGLSAKLDLAEDVLRGILRTWEKMIDDP